MITTTNVPLRTGVLFTARSSCIIACPICSETTQSIQMGTHAYLESKVLTLQHLLHNTLQPLLLTKVLNGKATELNNHVPLPITIKHNSTDEHHAISSDSSAVVQSTHTSERRIHRASTQHTELPHQSPI